MGLGNFETKVIVRYASYIVGAGTLISLVSTSTIHVVLLAASAAAYFVSEKL